MRGLGVGSLNAGMNAGLHSNLNTGRSVARTLTSLTEVVKYGEALPQTFTTNLRGWLRIGVLAETCTQPQHS